MKKAFKEAARAAFVAAILISTIVVFMGYVLTVGWVVATISSMFGALAGCAMFCFSIIITTGIVTFIEEYIK